MTDLDRIERFERSAFGLFVHFGLYSVAGKGEWYQHLHQVPQQEYEALFDRFLVNRDWAAKLVSAAKDTGCKYITLTTRHHDGFSLYDTKGLSDFDSVHSPTRRDLIAEFVQECNKNDIMPIFYHTLLDWKNADYQNNFPAYIDYLVESIAILCKNYGQIGGFWFDGMWDKPNDDWQEDRLYGTIRKYQPNAMIVNNTGLSAQGKVGHPEIDSVTFERGNPCFVDQSDKRRAGEMCQILNDHWGYAEDDVNYKSVRELIENLIDCRRFGCNFLLNTGLKGNGEISAMDRELLRQIGKWIKINRNFIYEAKPSDVKAENAIILQGNDCLYAVIKNVCMNADPNVAINGAQQKIAVDAPIRKAFWLDNGEEIAVEGNTFVAEPFRYGTSLSVRVAKILV